MSPLPSLHHIKPSSERDTVTVEQIWAQDERDHPLSSDYQHLIPLTVNGQLTLIATDENTGAVAAFQLDTNHPSLTPVESNIDLGSPYDQVEPFVIGNAPHLLTYDSEEGHFAFFPIDDALQSLSAYRYSRAHEPGVSTGFDTVAPMTIGGAVYYLCYDSKTGRVLIYSLAVTARSNGESAPLISVPVWEHAWAHGWTRFAFFELGGGTFFLKTNTAKLNVNIDHVLDTPSNGTAEIGTHLDLEDALELDIVRPFYLSTCDPYFLTYIKDGTTTINRIRADCEGWVTEARVSLPATATVITPFSTSDGCYLLVY